MQELNTLTGYEEGSWQDEYRAMGCEIPYRNDSDNDILIHPGGDELFDDDLIYASPVISSDVTDTIMLGASVTIADDSAISFSSCDEFGCINFDGQGFGR